jgi:hypothetical protein
MIGSVLNRPDNCRVGSVPNFPICRLIKSRPKRWYSLRVRENDAGSTARGTESLLHYLFRFVVGFLVVAVPLFALVALVLRISPARLAQPFLLMFATAFLVGFLVFLARKNRERPVLFSLFLSSGVCIYLFIFQIVVVYFGMDFGLIGKELRKTLIPVAVLVSVIASAIIFFRSKRTIETRVRALPE